MRSVIYSFHTLLKTVSNVKLGLGSLYRDEKRHVVLLQLIEYS